MLVQNGAIHLQEYHWERLFAGAQQLYLTIPALLTAGKLEAEVMRTVEKNRLTRLCRVRLQLFAGGGGLYGQDAGKPQFIIECFELTTAMMQLNENGLDVGIATDIAKSPDSVSNLKSCNALIYAVGARQARLNKWNDALICNTHGNIIESTLANIFWVKDSVIHTTPLAEGCVAGVMRRHIITRLGNVTEQALTPQILKSADEVFLTNAIKKIKWVRAIAGGRYTNHTIQKIAALLQ